ncbi:PorP/SprF family type IX secretion system membrane protein [Marinoscillum furvescens]|uniref:Type IX secretion system PorP/SprF family membrane protein n=1 Tax=Marinoscillum furvescens DSM 4134 TaxID=1122208 RepID=A0A3D9L9H9_MARFU|nr:type IX secretion system membrane protein PorP/SprF [Marinoscillum furvescens]REE02127.1 type IX secretion system PorP/SprF family membrane protein [Marinoscillum furvescens DSM 4134]
MKKLIFTLGILMVSFSSFAQLRPLTSTYPFNGLLINPAYAGSLNLLSVTAVHRRQWLNVDGAPTFTALTAHNSFMSNRIGVGLYAANDQIGAHVTNSLYGSYAYKIKTGIGILALGLQGGFDSRRSDFSELEVFDSSDPYFSGTVNRFTPNFGTGVYFANPNMYAGISVPYLLENKTLVLEDEDGLASDSRESRYYYATGGVIFPVAPNIKLSPSVLLRIQEQNRIAYDISGIVIFEDIAYVGLSYRNSNDITFIGQLILNENFRVGYAYDATTSEINTETTGSHEVLVNYRIKLHNYKKDPECPVYF